MTDLKIEEFCTREGLIICPIVYFNDEASSKQPNKTPKYEQNNKTIEELNKLNIENEKQKICFDIKNKNISKLDMTNKKNGIKYKKLSTNEFKTITECYSLFLKHHPHYYVIDVDEQKINSINDFIVEYENVIDKNIMDILKKLPWTKGNSKGIHIFIKLQNVPEYSNQQNVFNNFIGDLLKKNNVWEKAGKNYSDSKTIYKGNYEPYDPIDFEVIKPLINISKLNIKTDKPKKEPLNNNKLNIDTKNNNILNISYDLTVFKKLYAMYHDNTEKIKTIYFIQLCFEYNIFKTIDFSNYDKWIELATIIKEEFNVNGLDLFDEISKQIDKYQGRIDIEEKYNCLLKTFSKNPLSIGTLKYIVKDIDLNMYMIMKKQIDINILTQLNDIKQNQEIMLKMDEILKKLDENQTECKIAELFTIIYGHNFKSTMKDDKGNITRKCSYNNIGIWEDYKNIYQDKTIKGLLYKNLNEYIQNIYDKDLDNLKLKKSQIEKRDDITEEERLTMKIDIEKRIQDKTKSKNAIINLLETKSRLDNIQSVIVENIYDYTFEDKVNMKYLYLPMKDGYKINGQDLKISPLEKDDYFNFVCDAKYIENFNENMAEYQIVHNYFLSLMEGNPNMTQLLIDIIKTTLCGVKLKKIICFIGAHGSNGKSMLLELLKSIFKDFVGTITKNVLLNGVENSSGPTPDIMILKNLRLPYSSELSSEQKLHVDLKKISGADPITGRDMWEKPKTFVVPGNVFLISNEMPTIDVNDIAFMNRLVIFPFNNIFNNDPNFKNKIFGNKDAVFTYILKYGNILYDVEEEDDLMKAYKTEIIEENTKFEPIDIFIKQYCQNIIHMPLRSVIKPEDFIDNIDEEIKPEHKPYKEYVEFHTHIIQNCVKNNYYKDIKQNEFPKNGIPEENFFDIFVEYLLDVKKFNIKDKETFIKNITPKYRKKLRGLGVVDKRSNSKYYYTNFICSYPSYTQQYIYENENK